jgi:alpha-glucosidase
VGSQRYPALFLGDQQAGYEGIRHGLRGGLNLALTGFSYWTADVFGLLGKTTPETHMRYVQWSLLSPIARYFVRPEKTDNTRYPWSHNADVESNFRKYTELRMRLLPYYNSLAHESYLTGLPIMRPLLIEFENDIRLRSVDDQIMLGGALMICPILENGAVSRKIVLPEGLWHDFWSERSWDGSTTIEYSAPMDRLPILVRGGTILPLGPILQNIPDGHCFDSLEFHIWPPYSAEGVFFDDDGISTAYKQGAFSRTFLQAEKKDGNLIVHISAAQGGFPEQTPVRMIKIVSHGSVPIESARVNAKIVPYTDQTGFSHISFEHTTLKDSIIEFSFLS